MTIRLLHCTRCQARTWTIDNEPIAHTPCRHGYAHDWWTHHPDNHNPANHPTPATNHHPKTMATMNQST